MGTLRRLNPWVHTRCIPTNVCCMQPSATPAPLGTPRTVLVGTASPGSVDAPQKCMFRVPLLFSMLAR